MQQAITVCTRAIWTYRDFSEQYWCSAFKSFGGISLQAWIRAVLTVIIFLPTFSATSAENFAKLHFHFNMPVQQSANVWVDLWYGSTENSINNASQSLQWRHNGRDCVSNHQPHDCLLNRLFRRRSKNTSKLRVTGHCSGTSPGTGEFPVQMASYAENVSIWWRHHV